MTEISRAQVKACVRLVSREITTGDVERLQEDGAIHKGGLMSSVARSAIERARGMDNVNGVNGGLSPEIGEMSTADFSKKLDSVGNAPITDGCEQLGVGGCREDGGIDDSVKERAMSGLQHSE
jgi:hypothetical protein